MGREEGIHIGTNKGHPMCGCPLCISALLAMWQLLVGNLEADEESARLCGTIEVARITELATIEVGLEVVQDILYTGVHLQLDVVLKDEGVVELHVKVEEVGDRKSVV